MANAPEFDTMLEALNRIRDMGGTASESTTTLALVQTMSAIAEEAIGLPPLPITEDGCCPHCGIDLLDDDTDARLNWEETGWGRGYVERDKTDGVIVYHGRSSVDNEDVNRFCCGECNGTILLGESIEQVWS